MVSSVRFTPVPDGSGSGLAEELAPDQVEEREPDLLMLGRIVPPTMWNEHA